MNLFFRKDEQSGAWCASKIPFEELGTEDVVAELSEGDSEYFDVLYDEITKAEVGEGC